MAGVNSVLPKEPRNDILRMQNITIPNGTKKATNLGMKVFREKQCFNTQLAHMSSVFCPDHQVLLMPLPLNNSCPSTAPFQSSIQINSSSIEQNVSIQKVWVSLSLLKIIVISYTPTGSTWHHSRTKLHKLFYQLFYLK